MSARFMMGDFSWLGMPPLAALLASLDSEGEEARVVGGAVRNALLGEEVVEWDIATTALPQAVIARARDAGWKTAPTGIAHGTVTVIVDHRPFEVTTLREDIQTDGRHALVRFGRDFRADAFRRDFTINAISVSRDGTLHDYAQGIEDIAARRVRFIGEADRRIAEDYLRILRLFRFHARYGDGPIDRDSFSATIRGREGLRQLSAERIHAELLKLMMAKGAGDVLAEIDGAGFLALVLGGVARVAAFRRLTALEAANALAPDAVRRLAVLSLFTRADAVRIAALLRLSNVETKRIAGIALLVESLREPPSLARARELLYRLGRAGFEDGLLAAAAHAPESDFSPALALASTWPVPRNPFGGRDVAHLGIPAGPQVGQILSRAEQRWIQAGFPVDRQVQLSILQDAARPEP